MELFKVLSKMNEEIGREYEHPQEEPIQKKDRYPQQKPLMRVKDLIAKLHQEDQNAEVVNS